jgi:alpha-L-fucosidase
VVRLAALSTVLLLVTASAAGAATGQLGIFIHYGPASLLNKASEVDWISGVNAEDYPTVASSFQPNPAAAASWVALAKKAGATYLVFTARHHDGYTLWASDTTRDNRASGASRVPRWGATPDQDVLAALAKACRSAGIKLYVYYSLPDWWSHAYRVSDAERFYPMIETQLRELLTKYGPIGGVWIDGLWDRPLSFWHLDQIEQLIHTLQPQALIGVNRYPSAIEPGEDFQIYEKMFPAGRPIVPTEVTFPIGGLWFYSSLDRPKTQAQLRRLFTRSLSRGINLLLDVPPRGDGSISPTFAKALLAARAKPAHRP